MDEVQLSILTDSNNITEVITVKLTGLVKSEHRIFIERIISPWWKNWFKKMPGKVQILF